MKSLENRNYLVGIYIRISREDEDRVLESESITNQRSLLLQYVTENHLHLVDTYIDDGFSGTNFDRPDFNRLLVDIESGKINMVITKDMSRLGRDYIETGRFIEKYFPEHNVRYIAVTDNIDTFIDGTNNDIAPFKAIMNDMYAKDISKKIKTSLRAKQKEGKWVSGRCPFGYDIDPHHKNQLVINEKQASVVKKIFDLCLEGLTCYQIATLLTEQKEKTPAQYYCFAWKNNYHYNYGVWNPKTIKDILTNRMYLGDMVQNKRNKINYKIKKIRKNNVEDYIIVQHTQEAIIDSAIFYEAQSRLPKTVGRNEKKETHLLDGLLYCHDCGHRISVTPRRKKDQRCYTICNYYRTYMKLHVCSTHSNNYDKLEQVILEAIKNQCQQYVDFHKIKDHLSLEELTGVNEGQLEKEIHGLSQEIEQIHSNLDDAYLDKLNGIIDEKQYRRIQSRLAEMTSFKEKQLHELQNTLVNMQNTDCGREEMELYVDKFLTFQELDRELLLSLIARIEIYADKTIDIFFSFQNPKAI